jgi:hypothetical protein
LAIAGDAVIDPGIRPARRELHGGREGALGLAMPPERRPGLPIGIMRRRQIRRIVAGLACGEECPLRIALGEVPDGVTQP